MVVVSQCTFQQTFQHSSVGSACRGYRARGYAGVLRRGTTAKELSSGYLQVARGTPEPYIRVCPGGLEAGKVEDDDGRRSS